MTSTTKTFSLSAKPKLSDGDEESAVLQCEVTFSDALRTFLKDNIVAGNAGTKNITFEGATLERYKVKSGVLRRLPSPYGELLFLKELLDTGHATINTQERVYEVANKLQSSLDKLLDIIGEYSMEVSVTFEQA